MLLDPNGNQMSQHTSMGRLPFAMLDAVLRCQAIKEANAAFLQAQPPKDMHKVIYLCQREYAVSNTTEEEHPCCFASADATTCILVALHCPETNKVFMAHIDGYDCISPNVLLGGMRRPNAYLDAPQPVHLKVACVYDLNTNRSGAPITTAMGLDLTTGRVWPGPIPHEQRGPLYVRRLATYYAKMRPHPDGSTNPSALPVLFPLTCVYDDAQRLQFLALQMQPNVLSHIANTMHLPDELFMLKMSTSPMHEEPSFCNDQKGAMRWVMQRYDSILAGIPAMEMEWDSETSSWIEVVTE